MFLNPWAASKEVKKIHRSFLLFVFSPAYALPFRGEVNFYHTF